MKKTHKKTLGLLGLVLVVAMTVFATFLPSPGASATSSVTDTIVVIVENEMQPPSAKITGPDSGDRFLSPDQEIKVSYVNLKSYKLTVTYVDEKGNETIAMEIEVTDPDLVGNDAYPFRSIAEKTGYGKYLVKLEGVGLDDTTLPPDTVEFEYAAIDAAVETDKETGTTYVNLDYYPDQDGLTENIRIDYVVLTVYDKDGNPVDGIAPITVSPPTKRVEIPFNEKIASGDYIIVAEPFNAAKEALYESKSMPVKYEGGIVVPSTADTGGLFKNLNIARADYLITGIGVFLVVGIGSIMFISKRGKNSNRRK